jgi:hypothetical protein
MALITTMITGRITDNTIQPSRANTEYKALTPNVDVDVDVEWWYVV